MKILDKFKEICAIPHCSFDALKLRDYLVDFADFGARIPLTGFGYSLCKGVLSSVDEYGFRGIFTGGLADVATGIVMAVFFGLVASIVSKPKSKK